MAWRWGGGGGGCDDEDGATAAARLGLRRGRPDSAFDEVDQHMMRSGIAFALPRREDRVVVLGINRCRLDCVLLIPARDEVPPRALLLTTLMQMGETDTSLLAYTETTWVSGFSRALALSMVRVLRTAFPATVRDYHVVCVPPAFVSGGRRRTRDRQVLRVTARRARRRVARQRAPDAPVARRLRPRAAANLLRWDVGPPCPGPEKGRTVPERRAWARRRPSPRGRPRRRRSRSRP